MEVMQAARLYWLAPILNFTRISMSCDPARVFDSSSQPLALEKSSRSIWAADRLISSVFGIVSLVPYLSAYAETIGTNESAVKEKACWPEMTEQGRACYREALPSSSMPSIVSSSSPK